MPEGKTDVEDTIRVDTLDNIAANPDIKHIDLIMMDIKAHEIYASIRSTNSIRKGKLLTMCKPIPSFLSIFAYFLILLILVIAGFTY